MYLVHILTPEGGEGRVYGLCGLFMFVCYVSARTLSATMHQGTSLCFVVHFFASLYMVNVFPDLVIVRHVLSLTGAIAPLFIADRPVRTVVISAVL